MWSSHIPAPVLAAPELPLPAAGLGRAFLDGPKQDILMAGEFSSVVSFICAAVVGTVW